MDSAPARDGSLTAGPAGRARGVRVAALSILLLGALTALQLWRLCRASASAPLWDEAAHGYAGVRVAEALRHLDPLALLAAINAQVVWPFVHSLMLAPAFLVMGDGLAAAEALSIALYLGTVMALFAAGTLLHPTRGWWVGLLAASLALIAPSYGVFATLAMLEMPGAFLLALAFALHVRAAGEPLQRGRLLVAGWASTALVLCKYNYGLLWLVPLAIWEWTLLPADQRARAVTSLRERIRWRWWLKPMPLLFALGALAIVAILATGGGAITVAKQRLSFHSPGNLAYGLWLALLVWLVTPGRARPSRLGRLWRGSPERTRLLLQSVALPLAVWFTIPWPNRVRELFGFLANRDSGVPLWKPAALLFYPRALAADYSPAPWAGWLALGLALALFFDRRGAGERLAWLAFVVSFGATVLHRYRDSRFLFTVCPLLWLCAARALVGLAGAAFDRLPRRGLAELAWGLVAVATLVTAWFEGPTSAGLAARRRAYRSPASVVAVVDATLEALAPHPIAPDGVVAASAAPSLAAAAAALDTAAGPNTRAVLLGYSNVLSPALLAWRAHLTRPELGARALPSRPPGATSPLAASRWLAAHAEVVIAAIAATTDARFGREYQLEVKEDRETLAELRGDARRWNLTSVTDVSGFRVERFDRLP